MKGPIMILRKFLRKNKYAVRFVDIFREIYYKYLISPKRLLVKEFKKQRGYIPNLSNPRTFSEKLQWLKLNWYDDKAHIYVDKYLVRKHVANKIGTDYLNDLLGVYDKFDDIDFESLPKQFVIKLTHGSGYNIIVKNKSNINIKLIKNQINRWMKIKYHLRNVEWVYEGIKPRIIVEKFIVDSNESDTLTDYKFYCFHGKPVYCQVIRDRNVGESIDFYDLEWNLMPFVGMRNIKNSRLKHDMPKDYLKMIELAQILSEDFPFVRVDFYYVNNSIIFGELTFFPTSGYGKFYPDEWNIKIGDLINLSNK
jgi:hypothetical protein